MKFQLLLGLLIFSFSPSQLSAESDRVSDGLEVLYRFGEGAGAIIRDESGQENPLNLRVRKSSTALWKEGGLLTRSGATISSQGPADQLIQAIKKSNSLTVEAWIKPGNLRQKGPARMVSLSNGPSQRNFTLGQDGDHYDFRLRTSSTDKNGLPSTSSKNRTAKKSLTHVVCTRDASGNVKIYVDGKEEASKNVPGDFSNWDNQFSLNLANEFSGDRPWMGTLYLVAIYSKPLAPEQVMQNFQAGPEKGTPLPEVVMKEKKDPKAIFFETHIAPILARNCIECHDSFMKKGKLDLSRKSLALSGGESGKVIVPGKSSESVLWELVESDDMPTKGDPLTSEEKSLIKKWIDDGAHWSLETIDPVLYLHQNRKETVWIRRLTIPEYIETVKATVGVDISKEAHEILPADLRADGFSNTAYNLGIDLKHVESYSQLASIIVDRMDVLKFASRFSKSRNLSTDSTMRKFVEKMGKWVLRGPLENREVSLYSGIATTAAAGGGNYRDAVSLVLEAMLQSPRFIYRIENQKGSDPLQPAGDYELASRISYIIWGAPPDDQLYQAAERGDLQENELLQEQINRMLKDPRAVEQSLRFVSEWLNLGRLDHMNPDAGKFPEWNNQLASDMREETLAYFEDVVWKQNKPLSALFDTQTTFATPELAKHYGLEPKGSGLHQYDLSSVPSRGGLLTQGSVLTMGGDNASMVTRGLFVLHDVLRGTVKDPPPGLDITPVPSKPGISQRKISEERIANVSCGGCHSRFEPLAFGLEKFDGIGKFHDKDEFGNQLREDGEILFPGESKPVTYQTTQELMTLLANSERVQKTLTWKLTQFALGRPLDASDAESIDSIHESAMKNGGTWSSLISAIIKSDLVKLSQMESNQEKKKVNGNPLMKNYPVDRRTMLKSVTAASFIGLPLLEEMIGKSLPAAESSGVPVRSFNVFFGLGIPAPLQLDGYDGVLEPLKPLSDKLLIMRNVNQLRCDEKGINAHYDGAPGAFTAEPPNGEAKSGGPSIDQVIRNAHYPKGQPAGMVPTLVGGTFFRRSRVGRYVHSYNQDGTVAAMMQEKPRELFERVFGSVSISGNDPNSRRQRLKHSVLDSVVDDYKFYTGQNSPLGSASRARVKDHLDRIREFEQRAFAMRHKTTSGPKLPPESGLLHGGSADPGGMGIDLHLDELTSEWRLMADLYALAIQMDRVRFGSLTFLAAGERIRLKGDYEYNGKKLWEFDDAKQLNASGDKGCSHEWWHKYSEKKDNLALKAHAHMKMREVSYFLQKLDDSDSMESNGKTILENSLITISTESGDGRHSNTKRELSGVFHAITGANGRFKTGEIMDIHADGLDVYNTMLEGMGVSDRMGPVDRKMQPTDQIRV